MCISLGLVITYIINIIISQLLICKNNIKTPLRLIVPPKRWINTLLNQKKKTLYSVQKPNAWLQNNKKNRHIFSHEHIKLSTNIQTGASIYIQQERRFQDHLRLCFSLHLYSINLYLIPGLFVSTSLLDPLSDSSLSLSFHFSLTLLLPLIIIHLSFLFIMTAFWVCIFSFLNGHGEVREHWCTSLFPILPLTVHPPQSTCKFSGHYCSFYAIFYPLALAT